MQERSQNDIEPIDPFTWTPPRYLRRRAERSAQRRRLKHLTILGLLSLFLYGFVFADGGLVSILKLRDRTEKLQAQVDALDQRRQWLASEVERRKNDPATIERLAREEYGLLYPGEKIYRILEVSEEEARRVEAEKLRQLSRARTLNEPANP